MRPYREEGRSSTPTRSLAYSFGMLGCDLHCSYCQNWVTSQALRDPDAIAPPLAADPEELVKDALAQRAKVVVSTYNEPLITSEWRSSLPPSPPGRLADCLCFEWQRNSAILEYLHPWIDLYKVDLKSFDDRHYRELGGRLQPILEHHPQFAPHGIWIEIVTLLIPASTTATRKSASYQNSTRPALPTSPGTSPLFIRLQNDFARRYAPGRPAPRRRQSARIWIALHLRRHLSGQVKGLEDTHCHQCGGVA